MLGHCEALRGQQAISNNIAFVQKKVENSGETGQKIDRRIDRRIKNLLVKRSRNALIERYVDKCKRDNGVMKRRNDGKKKRPNGQIHWDGIRRQRERGISRCRYGEVLLATLVAERRFLHPFLSSPLQTEQLSLRTERTQILYLLLFLSFIFSFYLFFQQRSYTSISSTVLLNGSIYIYIYIYIHSSYCRFPLSRWLFEPLPSFHL